MHETAMMTNSDFSKRVRRMLGLGLDSWNNILLFFLAITAVAAAFVGFSTYATIQLAKQEAADSKREFDEYKLTVEGKVADAKTEGIKAGETAGNALVRAAALEKQAAELKAANLALEARIQPRRLSGEQTQKMGTILSKLQLPIAVVSRVMDPEGKDFADDLASVFTGAKWQVVQFVNWLRSDKGVFIATVEGTPLPPEVETTIATALDAANIEHKTITISGEDINRISPHFQSNVLYLLVGVKP
jgi:cell division protein FtsB